MIGHNPYLVLTYCIFAWWFFIITKCYYGWMKCSLVLLLRCMICDVYKHKCLVMSCLCTLLLICSEFFLVYSCGYDQIPGPFPHPFDGVLGLGKGKSSIVSQLSMQGLVQNVVGHCISVRGGGYLFFGDGLYDSSRVLWTSMSRDHP